MIGVALGAMVIAVDINDAALESASQLGAVYTVNSSGFSRDQVLMAIQAVAPAAIQVLVDALGREETAALGILSLAPRGRHVQIGLFSKDPMVPMGAVIGKELVILGSHGMPARDYHGLLALVESGMLRPEALIDHRLSLVDVPGALLAMAQDRSESGVTIIELA